MAFRGNPEDQAVLCTESCTFEVKEAETSNSLLILQKLEFPTSPCKIAKASSEHANVVGSEQSSIHMHSCEVGTVENVVDNRSVRNCKNEAGICYIFNAKIAAIFIDSTCGTFILRVSENTTKSCKIESDSRTHYIQRSSSRKFGKYIVCT